MSSEVLDFNTFFGDGYEMGVSASAASAPASIPMVIQGAGGPTTLSSSSNNPMPINSKTTSTKQKNSTPLGRPKKKKKEEEAEDKKDRPEAVRYHCDYCRKDISNKVRIKCAECNDFDLCTECFSVGVQIGGHKNFHPYQVIDNMNFTLFSPDWGADEELLLLEAIETYGLGNWTDIADNVGTKNLKECEAHYFSTYYDSPMCPLPDTSKVKILDKEPKAVLPQLETYTKPGASVPISQDHTGFMPNRLEFEIEYENDAEHVLAEMVYTEEDPEFEKELKKKLLLGYYQKLQERYKKRKFIIDNLLDLKKERRKAKEDKQVYNDHRIFMQLWSKEEHDALLEGLITEKKITERIKELQKYRSNGIQTLSDATIFSQANTDVEGLATGRKSAQYGEMYSSSHKRDSLNALSRDRKNKLRKNALGTDGKAATNNQTAMMAGLELLTKKEEELCRSGRIFPQQFFLIKEAIIREYLKSSQNTHTPIKRSSVTKLFPKIDNHKIGKIFDYLESAGIINNSGSNPFASPQVKREK